MEDCQDLVHMPHALRTVSVAASWRPQLHTRSTTVLRDHCSVTCSDANVHHQSLLLACASYAAHAMREKERHRESEREREREKERETERDRERESICQQQQPRRLPASWHLPLPLRRLPPPLRKKHAHLHHELT